MSFLNEPNHAPAGESRKNAPEKAAGLREKLPFHARRWFHRRA